MHEYVFLSILNFVLHRGLCFGSSMILNFAGCTYWGSCAFWDFCVTVCEMWVSGLWLLVCYFINLCFMLLFYVVFLYSINLHLWMVVEMCQAGSPIESCSLIWWAALCGCPQALLTVSSVVCDDTCFWHPTTVCYEFHEVWNFCGCL